MRILYAEDDYASRKATNTLLRKYGEVDTTINGEEAVSAFLMSIEEENFYQLVCLDIMMPGRDGIEALYMIREIEKKYQVPKEKCAKVLMVSALSDGEHVGEAQEFGCDGYVTKPFEPEKFEALLESLSLIEKEYQLLH